MHCPSFIFDMAAGRVASEFLESELGLEGFSGKYAVALGERYAEMDQDSLHQDGLSRNGGGTVGTASSLPVSSFAVGCFCSSPL